ncbi:transglutaminase family protein [Litorivicinus sp.]|jgi:transglutaminase-like putative cysteine protease|nr:transglutaminase family protein [Litorivicinus sp.]MDC1208601.1 transglutaminase family protein [Litorivicinus sp.]
MKYRIRHKNRYQYGQPVSLCHSSACLLPRDTLNQQVLSARLVILPVVDHVGERKDLFGNRLSRFSIEELHSDLMVLAESEVEVRPARNDGIRQIAWDNLAPIPPKTRLYLRPSLYVPTAGTALKAFAEKFFVSGTDLLDAIESLNEYIFNEFIYDSEFSDLETPVNFVLAEKRGVCQDFSHLMLAVLRSRGIACRYVSGYLETDPLPGQSKLLGADASHAWISVFVPGAGWVDLDPTNGLRPGDRHITLAWGRDYSDVIPLKGLMTGGSKHVLDVSVDVTRLE